MRFVCMLKRSERFQRTAPSNEALSASTAQRSFQFFVDGGGNTTQFILFSGTANQSATGHMQFVSQSGPLGLELFTSMPPSMPSINSIQPVSARRGEFNVN